MSSKSQQTGSTIPGSWVGMHCRVPSSLTAPWEAEFPCSGQMLLWRVLTLLLVTVADWQHLLWNLSKPNVFCFMVCHRAPGIQQKYFSCPGTDPKLLEGSNSGWSYCKGSCNITLYDGVARGTSRFLNRCQTCHLPVPLPSLISLIKN